MRTTVLPYLLLLLIATFFLRTNIALAQTSCPNDITICVESDPIALSGGTPSGGVYSGTGVSNGFFDPETAGLGTHQITYTQQTSSCSFEVKVIEMDYLCQLAEGLFDFNIADLPQYIGGCWAQSKEGKQYGITFIGDGITDNRIYPSAGLGPHPFSMQVDGVIGCAPTNPENKILTILGAICPEDMSICLQSDPILLSGGSSYPVSGNYSGTGVTNDYFDPKIAGVGTHTITYSYPDAEAQADVTNEHYPNFCMFKIEVIDGSISRPFDEGHYCADLGVINIVPYTPNDTPPFDTPAIPPFVWSGPGVVNANQIDLAMAGVGFHDYTATIPNSIGCPVYNYRAYVASGDVFVASCTKDMVVDFAAKPFSIPFPTFGGTDAQDPMITGIWYNEHNGFYGDGVNTNIMNWFDPSDAGLGDHVIMYSGYSYCSDKWLTCNFNINVYNLPVTLSAFSAKNIENKAELVWLTTEETNFDHFEIERSINPKSGFTKIHQISGNSFDKKYRYSDLNAPKGLPVYYRLKMVDMDGSFAYSKIEWALLDGVNKLTIFPNPASRTIHIEASEPLHEITILNSNGVSVFSEKLDSSKPAINLPALPSATYIARAKSSNGVTFYNLLVIK